jgi:hypothetical protein
VDRGSAGDPLKEADLLSLAGLALKLPKPPASRDDVVRVALVVWTAQVVGQ